MSKKTWWVALGLTVLISIGCILTFSGGGAVQDADGATTVVATSTSTTIDRELENRLKLEEVMVWNKAVEKNNFTTWFNHLAWIENTRQEQAERAAAKAAEEKKAQESRPSVNTPSSGRCGGNLPPCCVMERESGGSNTAQNPTSSASGKWQFIASTWGNYMGYPSAASAPEWVQDQRAAELWANGAGAGHWGGGC